jgi:flagellar biosynthesis/type III secretory pathway protein FliH
MSRDELAVIANSIGEALEAVEDWEFDTRLGVGPEDARDLRDQINEVLRSVPRTE